jgi:hypothetical protein
VTDTTAQNGTSQVFIGTQNPTNMVITFPAGGGTVARWICVGN